MFRRHSLIFRWKIQQELSYSWDPCNIKIMFYNFKAYLDGGTPLLMTPICMKKSQANKIVKSPSGTVVIIKTVCLVYNYEIFFYYQIWRAVLGNFSLFLWNEVKFLVRWWFQISSIELLNSKYSDFKIIINRKHMRDIQKLIKIIFKRICGFGKGSGTKAALTLI